MTEHRSPLAPTSPPLQITEDDASSSVAGHEPPLHQEDLSESPSEPDGTSFAVWGSLSPDHQTITSTQKQATMFATYFATLNLPLTHVQAGILLSSQTLEIAQYIKNF